MSQIQQIATLRPNLEVLQLNPNRRAIHSYFQIPFHRGNFISDGRIQPGYMDDDGKGEQACLDANTQLRQAALDIMGPMMPRLTSFQGQRVIRSVDGRITMEEVID